MFNLKPQSMKILKLILPAFLLLTFSNIKAIDNSNAQSLYIYNFIRYIKWPENTTTKNFVIGVYGESAVYNELVSLLKNRKIGTQEITVKVISKKEDIGQCHLLYIPASKKQVTKEISSEIGNKSILLISEAEGNSSSECTIEFFYSNNKLLFRINEEKAKSQNLYLSQSLINLSTKI
jgi:YfiR/HmsC-like